MNFFIDMDGVLADFDKGFNHIYGESPCEFKHRVLKFYEDSNLPAIVIEEIFSDLFWKMLDVIPRYWETLPCFSESVNDLNRFIMDYPLANYTILSSVPIHQPYYDKAIEGKKKWLQMLIRDIDVEKNVIFCPSRFYGDVVKNQYCNGIKDILIDDTDFEIKGWNMQGGMGIQYEADCIEVLSLYEILEIFEKIS